MGLRAGLGRAKALISWGYCMGPGTGPAMYSGGSAPCLTKSSHKLRYWWHAYSWLSGMAIWSDLKPSHRGCCLPAGIGRDTAVKIFLRNASKTYQVSAECNLTMLQSLEDISWLLAYFEPVIVHAWYTICKNWIWRIRGIVRLAALCKACSSSFRACSFNNRWLLALKMAFLYDKAGPYSSDAWLDLNGCGSMYWSHFISFNSSSQCKICLYSVW